MSVSGHECCAWCRPDEGMHCEINHGWHTQPVSPEVPPPTPEQRVEAMRRSGSWGDEADLQDEVQTARFYCGACLVWFRTLAEVPA